MPVSIKQTIAVIYPLQPQHVDADTAATAMTSVGANTASYDERPRDGANCMNELTDPNCTWIKARGTVVQAKKQGGKNAPVVFDGPAPPPLTSSSVVEARGTVGNRPNCMDEPTDPACTWIKASGAPIQAKKKGGKNAPVVMDSPPPASSGKIVAREAIGDEEWNPDCSPGNIKGVDPKVWYHGCTLGSVKGVDAGDDAPCEFLSLDEDYSRLTYHSRQRRVREVTSNLVRVPLEGSSC